MVRNVSVLFIITLLLSSLALSGQHETSESVLMPGSRIVAGDLSKNEFFILGKNESLPAPKSPSFELALHKELDVASHQKILSRAKVAMRASIEKHALHPKGKIIHIAKANHVPAYRLADKIKTRSQSMQIITYHAYRSHYPNGELKMQRIAKR